MLYVKDCLQAIKASMWVAAYSVWAISVYSRATIYTMSTVAACKWDFAATTCVVVAPMWAIVHCNL